MSNNTEMIIKAFGDFQCEMKGEIENLREEVLQQIQGVREEVSQQIQEVKGEVKGVSQRMDVLENEVKSVSQRLDETQEELREFSQRASVFEVETSDRVAALFDAYTINNEKHAAYENTITSLNAKVFNHQIRIEKLEGII